MTVQNSIKQFIKRIFNFLLNLLRPIYRFGGHVKFAIRRIGGLSSSVNKSIKIYREEGLKGVLTRFKKIIALNEKTTYQGWIERYDTLTPESRAKMRNLIKKNSSKPLISIIMPTFNTKSEWLIEAIESVRNQIYPNWELCIADDASTDPDVRPLLERYTKEDPRIKVIFREKNGHISESSNTALKLATGDWIALFDHDDLLSETALFWVVEAIKQNPKAQLIYSDEDKIDERGVRQAPYFKCDWNVDLFYSHNLITHLGVYRAKLVKKIGGFRVGLEGSQDHDLALRYIEHIKPNQIHHIPRILYHWRIHSLSTAKSGDNKSYAKLAGVKALNDHFKRQNINAKAEPVDLGFRVRYQLPPKPPLVSLIIPTRNGLSLLKTCVNSIIEKTTYPHYEIIIVDNGSDDPATLQFLDDLKNSGKATVIRDDSPFNYSALNNKAVKLAKGEIVGLLNNDLEVISPGWLSEMASHALRPEIGAVGAKLWYPNNTLQHGGVIIGLGGVAGHAHKHLARGNPGYMGRAVLIQNLSAVTAACLVVRKSVYEEVHGLEEKKLTVAFNDVDFCLRLREKGYRNLFTPYAEFYHYESATRGYEDNPEKIRRFQKEIQYMNERWGDQLLNDPAYSPNLTLDHENFHVASPPRVEQI
jgi:glycosyltransferase involved in cell wall biosynthesis